MFTILRYTIALLSVHHIRADNVKHSVQINEDALILQKSVKLFGSPRTPDYKNISLPGLELALDDDRFLGEDVFLSDGDGNYTLKLRAVTENFSYNDHYETAEVEKIGKEKIVTIKGQYTEKIPRRGGGYYLRTIGYVKDETGYSRFLVDISKVRTIKIQKLKPKTYFGGGGCGKRRRRSPISPCAIWTSLVGR